jgi:putative SOS response-associated peptidase YedK
MCNDFGNHIPYDDYLRAFSQTRIPVKWPSAAPNLEPRDDIWPTDPASVICRLGNGTNSFKVLRWGFAAARPKGPPVINFRSEGRRFSSRAVSGSRIPAGRRRDTALPTDVYVSY